MANTGVDLAHAMVSTRTCAFLVLQGIYDLATQFLGTGIHGVTPSTSARPSVAHRDQYYDAGHMMLHPRAFAQEVKLDVAAFIDGMTGSDFERMTDMTKLRSLHRSWVCWWAHYGDDRHEVPAVQSPCVDMNEARIAAWKTDDLPIYEPGCSRW